MAENKKGGRNLDDYVLDYVGEIKTSITDMGLVNTKLLKRVLGRLDDVQTADVGILYFHCGMLRESRDILKRLVDETVDYSVYLRLAYLEKLIGDIELAKEFMLKGSNVTTNFYTPENKILGVKKDRLDNKELEATSIDLKTPLNSSQGILPILRLNGKELEIFAYVQDFVLNQPATIDVVTDKFTGLPLFGEDQKIVDFLRCFNSDFRDSVLIRGGITAEANGFGEADKSLNPDCLGKGYGRYFGELKHVASINRWLEVISPDAPIEVYFASLLHDIERFGRHPVNKKDFNLSAGKGYEHWKEDYIWYKREHAKKSAEFATEYLTAKLGHRSYAPKMVEDVRELIIDHEFGETEKGAIIKDADSLSFFESNVDWYLEKEDVKNSEFKIRFMYERMGEGARFLALPLYKLAMYKLGLKCLQTECKTVTEELQMLNVFRPILEQARELDENEVIYCLNNNCGDVAFTEKYKKGGTEWIMAKYKKAIDEIRAIESKMGDLLKG